MTKAANDDSKKENLLTIHEMIDSIFEEYITKCENENLKNDPRLIYHLERHIGADVLFGTDSCKKGNNDNQIDLYNLLFKIKHALKVSIDTQRPYIINSVLAINTERFEILKGYFSKFYENKKNEKFTVKDEDFKKLCKSVLSLFLESNDVISEKLNSIY